MGQTRPDRDSGAQKKKMVGTAEVAVEPCVSVITVLYRYRYCHPTTRLSRADLENHQVAVMVTYPWMITREEYNNIQKGKLNIYIWQMSMMKDGEIHYSDNESDDEVLHYPPA